MLFAASTLLALAPATAAPGVPDPPCDISPEQVDAHTGRRQEGTLHRLGDDRYRLVLCVRVAFSAGDAFPVEVALGPPGQPPTQTVTVEDRQPFRLEAEVAAGSWMVRSEVQGADGDRYWSAFGPSVFVEPGGRFQCRSDCVGPIWHGLKVQHVAPQWMQVVDEVRPTLRWQPIEGTIRTDIQYYVHDWPGGERVVRSEVFRVEGTGTTWTFPEDLPPDKRVEWDVRLSTPDQSRWLAHGNAYFLTRGSDPTAAVPGPAPAAPAVWLGVSLRPYPRGLGPPDQARGVHVTGVSAGSPAMEAGLRPDDVVLGFAGEPVTSIPQFLKLVGGVEAGTRVEIEIQRGDTRRTLPVTPALRPTRETP